MLTGYLRRKEPPVTVLPLPARRLPLPRPARSVGPVAGLARAWWSAWVRIAGPLGREGTR